MIQNIIVPAFFLLYLTHLQNNHPLRDRLKKRYYFFWGGRGSGKSIQTADYIISEMRKGVIRVLCAREIQKSIKQSVLALLEERINVLGFAEEFTVGKTEIKHTNGSLCMFTGLQDHTADSIKSYHNIDICWLEEAQSVSARSLKILLPTIRRDAVIKRKNKDVNFDPYTMKLLKTDRVMRQASHFIFTYNRYMENDPVHVLGRRELKAAKSKEFETDKGKILRWTQYEGPDAYGLFINAEGNHLFPAVLRKEMEKDYADDPDSAAHVWGGEPVGQAAYAIFNRTMIRDAVEREIDPGPYGITYVGVDVARYGDDKTVMYKRKGNTVLDVKRYKKLSVPQVAQLALEFGGFDNETVYIVDDTGVGGGVTDIMAAAGWKVHPVNFAQKAIEHQKYDSVVSEMVFNIRDKINKLDIPDIPELREELNARTWFLTPQNKRAVESKKDFKKRLGRSCDDFDAFILSFYEPMNLITAEPLGELL